MYVVKHFEQIKDLFSEKTFSCKGYGGFSVPPGKILVGGPGN